MTQFYLVICTCYVCLQTASVLFLTGTSLVFNPVIFHWIFLFVQLVGCFVLGFLAFLCLCVFCLGFCLFVCFGFGFWGFSVWLVFCLFFCFLGINITIQQLHKDLHYTAPMTFSIMGYVSLVSHILSLSKAFSILCVERSLTQKHSCHIPAIHTIC